MAGGTRNWYGIVRLSIYTIVYIAKPRFIPIILPTTIPSWWYDGPAYINSNMDVGVIFYYVYIEQMIIHIILIMNPYTMLVV
jgi:hypothetical protein